MSIFFHQYFDLDIIRHNFSFVLAGFGQTVLLSVISAALAMSWGLVLALLPRLLQPPLLLLLHRGMEQPSVSGGRAEWPRPSGAS